MRSADGAAEWSLLQNQLDSYEKYSLIIKLANVFILAISVLLDRSSVIVGCLLAILWLQDAIWKTFQSRIEHRLLKLEGCLADESVGKVGEVKPYQFNSEYLQNRGGNIALIGEYLGQSVRPTVAFPHAVLLAVWLVSYIGG